jgi:hypothetical protein
VSTIQSFDYSENLLSSLQWRNNEAPNIQQLLQYKQDYWDENQVDFWESWYDDVFNLKTANKFGLYVWSIILNMPISIQSNTPAPNSFWGYGPFRVNYNNAGFTTIGNIVLTEEEARIILRLRYYQLVISPTVTNINFVLNDLFSDQGLAYVEDNLDMTMTYNFDFVLSAPVQLIFNEYDILPRPAGVSSTFVAP